MRTAAGLKTPALHLNL